MEKQKKKEFFVYLLLTCIFFVPIIVFIFCVWFFFPLKIATTVIGFVGLVVIVGGPFWAMQMEQKLRKRFLSDKTNECPEEQDLFEE
jgi:hypothetical protein